MKKFDFTALPNSNTNYGKKNVKNGIKNIENNKGLMEVAKRLVDK